MKNFWQSLDPKQKKIYVQIAGALLFVLLAWVAYEMTRGKVKREPAVSAKEEIISVDKDLLEKSFFEQSRKARARDMEALKALQGEIESLRKELETEKINRLQYSDVTEETLSGEEAIGKPELDERKTESGSLPANVRDVRIPPPPPGFPRPGSAAGKPPSFGNIAATQPGKGGPQPEQPQLIGGISVVSVPQDKREGEKGMQKKKKGIYLPPSFMEATLISGVNAPTLEAAKSQPRPVFLRIKDLAVLPNSIKTNLKGCFVIAEGHGDLSDERVHLRLTNLSCLARDGKSVVDSTVKGFVVDGDGKIGLKGDVVTKMGAILGRSFLAGFFGGVGDAFSQSTQTTAISALGTTQTVDSAKILQSGLGSGMSTGFEKLQDFYMDMARQTFPVVEVGALKTVTIVISEGIELQIRNDYCTGGIEECGDI